MRRIMRKGVVALALACACAGHQKEDTAAKLAQANGEPKPVELVPAAPADKPLPPPLAPKVEPDPWANREDLFVAPKATPTTQVKLGAVERYTMPNGLRVILVPRTDVPVVDVAVAVRAGKEEEPLELSGVAEFTANMLRKGTAKRTSDQIAQAIDFVGGELDGSAGEEGTFVTCHARARDFGLCLDLTQDVTLHPSFPEAELGEIRDQLFASVERAKDSAQALAAEHAANLFFGEDDPRGRPMSKRSITAIDRKALVAFHKAWFLAGNALVVVAGDFDAKKIKNDLRRAFGSWRNGPLPTRVPDALKRAVAHSSMTADAPVKVRVVDKPDATQSTMVLAGPGIAHRSADYYAVRLMNYALGGGLFSSRLMKVVRSEGGKTYGAHSRFDARREPGPFTVSTFTRNTETGNTLALVAGEVVKMREHGPTAEELEAAKGNLIGGYGLHLETANDVARALLSAELDQLDRDYVERYPERLQAVTLADATRAAAAHLKPTVLVVVGKADEIAAQLAAAHFAPSETIDYTAPVTLADRRAEAATRSQAMTVSGPEAAAGRKLLETALKAKGAIDKVTDVKLTGKGTMTMQNQTIEVTLDEYQLPGKAARQDVNIGPMKVSQIFADGKALVKQGTEVQELPPAMMQEMKRSLWRDPNFILVNASAPTAKVRALPPVADGAMQYEALEVISPDGDVTRVLLDPKTHLIARLAYGESGKETRIDLSDYQTESGVAFPLKIAQTGPTSMQITYSKVEVNKGLPAQLFKP